MKACLDCGGKVIKVNYNKEGDTKWWCMDCGYTWWLNDAGQIVYHRRNKTSRDLSIAPLDCLLVVRDWEEWPEDTKVITELWVSKEQEEL